MSYFEARGLSICTHESVIGNGLHGLQMGDTALAAQGRALKKVWGVRLWQQSTQTLGGCKRDVRGCGTHSGGKNP